MMAKRPVKIIRDPVVFTCLLACFVAFGGFVAWAGLVKLDEGVAASGVIVVEDNRQVVQHLEGGIIEAIAIKEGSQVLKGDTLLVLTNTAGQAARLELAFEAASLDASIIRRDAQGNRGQVPDFSKPSQYELPKKNIQNIIKRETELFQQETESLNADIAVLTGRQNQAKKSSQVIKRQRDSANKALFALRDQLTRKRKLVQIQLARIDEVRVLERDVAGMQSETDRLQNEINRAAGDALIFSNQVKQTRAKYTKRLAEERLEARRKLQSIQERLVAAKDVIDRTIIVAPQSGEIFNLNVHTIGGVIKPGETILEIVPNSVSVIASIKVNPSDRASVFEGLTVRTKISAFDNREMPELQGVIISLSGDLKTDPATRAVYYEALVRIEGAAVDIESEKIIPGLPVDVFIFSGAKRTTLEYIFDPLSESFFKGLRRK